MTTLLSTLLLASLHPVAIGGIIAVAVGVILVILAIIAFIDLEEWIALWLFIAGLAIGGGGAYFIYYGDYLNRIA